MITNLMAENTGIVPFSFGDQKPEMDLMGLTSKCWRVTFLLENQKDCFLALWL